MAYQTDGGRIDHGSDAVAASVALALGATRTARPPRTERAFACGADGPRARREPKGPSLAAPAELAAPSLAAPSQVAPSLASGAVLVRGRLWRRAGGGAVLGAVRILHFVLLAAALGAEHVGEVILLEVGWLHVGPCHRLGLGARASLHLGLR